MRHGVVFDMDGLMFDTEYLATLGWEHGIEVLGYHTTRAFLISFKGRTDYYRKQSFLHEFGSDFPYAEAKRLKEEYVYAQIDEKGVPLKKNLIELLEYLKAHDIAAAVATSTEHVEATKFVRQAGIDTYMTVLVFGDMVTKSKPEPDIYIEAFRRLGVEPENGLVLEDSPAGICAGSRAGAKVIHIPDMIQLDEKVTKLTAAVCNDLGGVIPWIEQHWKLQM